jgi:hypothetical protein
MTRKIVNQLLSILLLSSVLTLTACQYKPISVVFEKRTPPLVLKNLGDGGLLSGDPCGPPCFLKIQPGITTKQQVLEILKARTNLQDCVFTSDAKIEYSYLTCEPADITFDKSGIVGSINFKVQKPVPIGDIIAKFGQPSNVYINTTKWDNKDNTLAVGAKLFYNDLRMSIYLADENAQTYSIAESSQVLSIAYFSKDMWGSMLPGSIWTGYEKYENDYSSPYP